MAILSQGAFSLGEAPQDKTGEPLGDAAAQKWWNKNGEAMRAKALAYLTLATQPGN